MGKVLVVEDDRSQLASLERLVSAQLGYETIHSMDGKEAVQILSSHESRNIDLVLLDLIMPVMDGFSVLREMKPLLPHTPFIVTTADSEVSSAVKAMQLGASDFLLKPIEPERLKISASNALRIGALKSNLSRMARNQSGQVTFSDIIGKSPRFLESVKLAKKASASDIPLLVEGESGTGKELLAKAIHGCSLRSGKQFISVNCASASEAQVETLLFGSEKAGGSGTLGKLREAEGGTFFIDEVGELKPDIQAKLMRAIDSGKIHPVGAQAPTLFNTRIITATSKNLSLEVVRGRFREDLFYALSALSIAIPALRERDTDIVDLAQFFLKKHTAIEGKIVSRFTEDALSVLRCFIWPGNVRQLDNVIFRAVALTNRNYLDAGDFSYLLPKSTSDSHNHMLPAFRSMTSGNGSHQLSDSGFSPFKADGNLKKLDDIETEIISLAIEKYNGRISEVARRLGVGRSTIYRKLESKPSLMPASGNRTLETSFTERAIR